MTSRLILGVYAIEYQGQEHLYLANSVDDLVGTFIEQNVSSTSDWVNLRFKLLSENNLEITPSALESIMATYDSKEPQTQVSVSRPITKDNKEHTAPSSLRPSGNYTSVPQKK